MSDDFAPAILTSVMMGLMLVVLFLLFLLGAGWIPYTVRRNRQNIQAIEKRLDALESKAKVGAGRPNKPE